MCIGCALETVDCEAPVLAAEETAREAFDADDVFACQLFKLCEDSCVRPNLLNLLIPVAVVGATEGVCLITESRGLTKSGQLSCRCPGGRVGSAGSGERSVRELTPLEPPIALEPLLPLEPPPIPLEPLIRLEKLPLENPPRTWATVPHGDG